MVSWFLLSSSSLQKNSFHRFPRESTKKNRAKSDFTWNQIEVFQFFFVIRIFYAIMEIIFSWFLYKSIDKHPWILLMRSPSRCLLHQKLFSLSNSPCVSESQSRFSNYSNWRSLHVSISNRAARNIRPNAARRGEKLKEKTLSAEKPGREASEVTTCSSFKLKHFICGRF